MKKFLKFLLIVFAIGLVIYGIINVTTPRSEKIRKEMSSILHDPSLSTFEKDWRYDRLKRELPEAYNKENRPDDAIEMLTDLLKENKKPQYNIYGQERPRISADYFFESLYYKTLAEAFDIKGDKIARDKALKKAEQAKRMEDKLRPAEEAREAREKKKERQALLN